MMWRSVRCGDLKEGEVFEKCGERFVKRFSARGRRTYNAENITSSLLPRLMFNRHVFFADDILVETIDLPVSSG